MLLKLEVFLSERNTQIIDPHLGTSFHQYLFFHLVQLEKDVKVHQGKWVSKKASESKHCFISSVLMLSSLYFLLAKPWTCSSNSVSQDGSLAIFSCKWHHKTLHFCGFFCTPTGSCVYPPWLCVSATAKEFFLTSQFCQYKNNNNNNNLTSQLKKRHLNCNLYSCMCKYVLVRG